MRQKLFIDAEGMYFNDEKSLPRKKIPPEEIYRRYGADFTRINEISSLLTEDAGEYGEQIRLGGGLDNAFCLRRGRRTDEPACLLKSSDGKRSVELYTDAPDLVCYTAGGLVEGIPLLPKGKSIRRGAVALEAQEIPTLEPMRPLCPGETFHRFIAYHLKW